MKKIPLVLCLSLILSQSAQAQSVSCSTRIWKLLDKRADNSKGVAAGGLTGGGLVLSVSFQAALGPVGLITGAVVMVVGGAVAGTMAGVEKHRENMIEILEGAATGGNAKTKKLWKIAHKKNPQAFKGISYEQFLESIHKANLSGSACQVETVPERKDIIKILVQQKEIEDQTLVGEKEASSKESLEDSGRGIQLEKHRQILEPAETSSGRGSKEY